VSTISKPQKMQPLINRILNKENLYLAWEKLKFSLRSGEALYNDYELSAFELKISSEFDLIIQQGMACQYRMQQIRPIGFPKAGLNDEKEPETRQMFEISLRDQLVWIAVANIIGGELDQQMPFWSYGNRLFISTFFQHDENNVKHVKFGWYRNTSGFIYRKWHQSWPRFRKHITLTIKKMAEGMLTPEEEEEVRMNNSINGDVYRQLKCEYLSPQYWTKSKNIYWASIDFKKFFPKSNLSHIKANLLELLDSEADDRFRALLNCLCAFEINYSLWSDEELQAIGLSATSNTFDHIPTGLFVAGFLSNVLMLKIDVELSNRLSQNKNIAHFRFVDDHIIIANDFDALISWIADYRKLLSDYHTGVELNDAKTEPNEVLQFLNKTCSYEDAKKACKLDPDFPSPLMTETLAKVSAINDTEFEMLSESEKDRFTEDVEHLLLADFNNQEIKKDTRLSFAASVLTKIIPQRIITSPTIAQLREALAEYAYSKRKAKLKEDERTVLSIQKQIDSILIKLEEEEKRLDIRYQQLFQRVARLLQKVIYENPDKVRLWKRLIEFSLNTGVSQKADLFALVKRVKNDRKLSPLAVEYLQAFIFQHYAILSTVAVVRIESQKFSTTQKERAKAFLSDCINYLDREINFSKTYTIGAFNRYSDTMEIIGFTSSTKTSTSQALDLKFELNDYWFSEQFSTQVWSLAKRLCHGSEPPLFLKEVLKNLQHPAAYPRQLLFLFPKLIDHSVYLSISDDKEATFMTCEYLMNQPKLSQDDEHLARLKNLNPDIFKANSLVKWIKFIQSLEVRMQSGVCEENKYFYDPRISEWSMLEITKQIAQALLSKQQDFAYSSLALKKYLTCIHPLNYIVPIEWNLEITPTWHEWEILTSEKGISLIKEIDCVYDQRYSSLSSDIYDISDELSQDDHLLQGLAILLISLLTRDFTVPTFWNNWDHQKIWANLIFKKIESVPLSSLTRQIIFSVFSKRNKETKILKLLQPLYLHFQEDTLLDPPSIDTLQNLIDRINYAQKVLQIYRVNVNDNKPRQLIPVSLRQLTTEFNPYDDNEN
jgi:hypothetical protein